MNGFLLFLAILPTLSALRCFVNQTHTEECTGLALGSNFPLLCYNRTVTEEGHHRHTYGCASFFQRMIPTGCIVIDRTPWLDKGKVCLCDSEGCNKHVHRTRASRNYSASLSISPFITFLIFSAL